MVAPTLEQRQRWSADQQRGHGYSDRAYGYGTAYPGKSGPPSSNPTSGHLILAPFPASASSNAAYTSSAHGSEISSTHSVGHTGSRRVSEICGQAADEYDVVWSGEPLGIRLSVDDDQGFVFVSSLTGGGLAARAHSKISEGDWLVLINDFYTQAKRFEQVVERMKSVPKPCLLRFRRRREHQRRPSATKHGHGSVPGPERGSYKQQSLPESNQSSHEVGRRSYTRDEQHPHHLPKAKTHGPAFAPGTQSPQKYVPRPSGGRLSDQHSGSESSFVNKNNRIEPDMWRRGLTTESQRKRSLLSEPERSNSVYSSASTEDGIYSFQGEDNANYSQGTIKIIGGNSDRDRAFQDTIDSRERYNSGPSSADRQQNVATTTTSTKKAAPPTAAVLKTRGEENHLEDIEADLYGLRNSIDSIDIDTLVDLTAKGVHDDPETAGRAPRCSRSSNRSSLLRKSLLHPSHASVGSSMLTMTSSFTCFFTEVDVFWARNSLGISLKQHPRTGVPIISDISPTGEAKRQASNLRVGDYLIRINSRNTNELPFEDVICMLRNDKKPLFLHFKLQNQPEQSANNLQSLLDNCTRQTLSDATVERMISCAFVPPHLPPKAVNEYEFIWKENKLGIWLGKSPHTQLPQITQANTCAGNGEKIMVNDLDTHSEASGAGPRSVFNSAEQTWSFLPGDQLLYINNVSTQLVGHEEAIRMLSMARLPVLLRFRRPLPSHQPPDPWRPAQEDRTMPEGQEHLATSSSRNRDATGERVYPGHGLAVARLPARQHGAGYHEDLRGFSSGTRDLFGAEVGRSAHQCTYSDGRDARAFSSLSSTSVYSCASSGSSHSHSGSVRSHVSSESADTGGRTSSTAARERSSGGYSPAALARVCCSLEGPVPLSADPPGVYRLAWMSGELCFSLQEDRFSSCPIIACVMEKGVYSDKDKLSVGDLLLSVGKKHTADLGVDGTMRLLHKMEKPILLRLRVGESDKDTVFDYGSDTETCVETEYGFPLGVSAPRMSGKLNPFLFGGDTAGEMDLPESGAKSQKSPERTSLQASRQRESYRLSSGGAAVRNSLMSIQEESMSAKSEEKEDLRDKERLTRGARTGGARHDVASYLDSSTNRSASTSISSSSSSTPQWSSGSNAVNILTSKRDKVEQVNYEEEEDIDEMIERESFRRASQTQGMGIPPHQAARHSSTQESEYGLTNSSLLHSFPSTCNGSYLERAMSEERRTLPTVPEMTFLQERQKHETYESDTPSRRTSANLSAARSSYPIQSGPATNEEEQLQGEFSL